MIDPGQQRELELYNALKEAFGSDCVYHSPKYKKAGGEEKELSDILILALPYMISIQMKWLSYTSADIESVRGEVITKRIEKRIEAAAGQHKGLVSFCKHNDHLILPCVWSDSASDTYELPVSLIKKVIPIVVVDFNDKNYESPERRLQLPPIVVQADDEVAKKGVVQAFMFRDFLTILKDLFTVGDLLSYLDRRNVLVAKQDRFDFGYDELSVFSMFLTKRDVFDEMINRDFVIIADRGIYEERMKELQTKLEMRRRLYEEGDIIDWVLDMLKRYARTHIGEGAEVNGVAVSYIVNQSRLKCLGSMLKRIVSNKISQCWQDVLQNAGCDRFSYIINNEGVVDGQAIILGCINQDDDTFPKDVLSQQMNAFRRFMTVRRSDQIGDIKETLMILFTKSRQGVSVRVDEIGAEDFGCVLSDDEAATQKKNLVRGKCDLEEWSFIDAQSRLEGSMTGNGS